ncbi:MAG: DUF4249 family protein [Bacteroidetes bacterium]|nr:DUF4249 family protein [Bacteroidota bacterium]MBS1740998.1 DUF4249 family protein [Bacteroidota bacterium]
MKKLLLSLFAAIGILSLQSCSEDFEVAAPYKPMTIVFGILNMSDTAHYIRIQKSFLDEHKNAFDMAKVSDSNFYKESDLMVVVKEMSGSTQTAPPIPLTRVDMNQEGYPKDSGTFFKSPNYAYKFKWAINPSRTYRLVITNKATNITDSSEIRVVDAGRLDLSGGNIFPKRLSFPLSQSGQVLMLFLDQSIVGNVDYVEAAIRFRWVNKNTTTNQVTRDSADYTFATISGDALKDLKLQTEASNLYRFLADAMKPAPIGVDRYMDSCRILLLGTGKEYINYLTTSQIQSSGLTSGQIKPLYTNIMGKDVFGLYTSEAKKYIPNAYIDDITLNALKTDPLTTSLRIMGRPTP